MFQQCCNILTRFYYAIKFGLFCTEVKEKNDLLEKDSDFSKFHETD